MENQIRFFLSKEIQNGKQWKTYVSVNFLFFRVCMASIHKFKVANSLCLCMHMYMCCSIQLLKEIKKKNTVR